MSDYEATVLYVVLFTTPYWNTARTLQYFSVWNFEVRVAPLACFAEQSEAAGMMSNEHQPSSKISE